MNRIRCCGWGIQEIVNASRKDLWAQAAVDKPLLIPDGLECLDSCLTEQSLDVRSTKQSEPLLVPGIDVGIAWIEWSSYTTIFHRRYQNQAGVKVGLEQDIDMDILTY